MRRGGLYVWRVNKPHAVIGLPFVGRHWAYAGMTSSYFHRGIQHGETAYWSDLRPKCYRILPLPDFLLRGDIPRMVTKALETVLIGILCPVYNVKQQAPWNFRKISKVKARRQRAAREMYGKAGVVGTAAVRMVVWAVFLAAVVWMGIILKAMEGNS